MALEEAIVDKRCEEFYFNDPDLVLKVSTILQSYSEHDLKRATLQAESTLFKIPSFYFRRDSKVFQDMYLLPQADGSKADGSSDDQPLILPGVLASELKTLLGVMFPRYLLYQL
jgi:hypothetical protein